MKDQFVGDVKDFMKYSMLRQFQTDCGLPLVVCWMRTAPTPDGYFAQQKLAALEPHVFHRLDTIKKLRTPSIADVQAAGVLPPGTRFFDKLLHPGNRTPYFTRLWQEVPSASLLFFDPDTGLAHARQRVNSQGSEGYLFMAEANIAYGLGHSIVVYQHRPQRQPWRSYLPNCVAALSATAPESFAVQSGDVALLVLPQANLARILLASGQSLVTRWGAAGLSVTVY